MHTFVHRTPNPHEGFRSRFSTFSIKRAKLGILMTFCRSRAAAAKKWIKKRDLAIEFLFCLLNSGLLFLIFDVLVVAAVVAS